MNDLRREINEVFARQQTQLGDIPGASNRMLRATLKKARITASIATATRSLRALNLLSGAELLGTRRE